MGLQEKRAGIQQQDPEGGTAARAIEFFGAVAAEHSGTDHDRIERIGADRLGGRDLLPVVAYVSGDDVVSEIRLLYVVTRGAATGKQLIQ